VNRQDIKMRTTRTIADQLPDDQKQRARTTGQPFREVMEQALRTGLAAVERPQPAPYRIRPHALGQPRSALDLVKARALADALEDAALAAKLIQRR
jgi:hypothetical protein